MEEESQTLIETELILVNKNKFENVQDGSNLLRILSVGNINARRDWP